MEEPLVSVIVPIYNVEAYVGECMQSLLAQAFRDFEVLCVDDGSTDASVRKAKEAVGQDARFVFLGQPNAGASAARNKALSQARGRYVLFLDSDDAYSPDALETLVGIAQAEDLDLLYFSASTFYENAQLARTHAENLDERTEVPQVLSGQELLVELERTDSFRPSVCLCLFRRGLIEETGLRFEEGILAEDLLFTMQILPQAKRATYRRKSLYRRRMRADSTTTKDVGISNIHGHFVAARGMLAWYRQNAEGTSQAFRDAYCHRLFSTWETAARLVPEVGEEEVLEYRDGLSPADRDLFNVHVFEMGKMLDEAYRSVLHSRTYRAGKAITALPMWLRDHSRR